LFSGQKLRYFSDAWIQLGVFAGTDKTTILNTQKVTSYLTEAPTDVLNFIKKNIRVGLKIEDIKHEEVWEIPKVALREAIINAIVHTDYSIKGAPIRVALFEDRIEIENSALLPWGLTFEDLKSGVSKLRNPVIARVFNELGLIEQWGSGIKRMMQACENAGLLPPSFEEIGPRIRVTFYKQKIKQPVIDSTDRQILDLFQTHETLSTKEATAYLKLSKRAVINRLAKLVDRGLIITISQNTTDPQKRYRLI
jgi:ATP-dependent DNA helicase RecG